jgi:hypothetical protein
MPKKRPNPSANCCSYNGSKEVGMSWRWSLAGLSATVALSACSSTKPPPSPPPRPAFDMPLAINNGAGSQYGNYAAQEEREERGPSGERCVIYNWDRPLTSELAIRLKSASCEAKEAPGLYVSHEISRIVIPITESNLMEP